MGSVSPGRCSAFGNAGVTGADLMSSVLVPFRGQIKNNAQI